MLVSVDNEIYLCALTSGVAMVRKGSVLFAVGVTSVAKEWWSCTVCEWMRGGSGESTSSNLERAGDRRP